MPDKKSPKKSSKSAWETMPEDLLGERVRSVREKLGLTHDGLSNLTKIEDQEGRGISRTTIRGYEIGTYRPGARELRILSLALRVTPTWLLLGESDNPKGKNTQLEQTAASSTWRWANTAFPAFAFTQIGAEERRQISDLIETLYRFQIGELRFRQTRMLFDQLSGPISAIVQKLGGPQDIPQVLLKEFLAKAEEGLTECQGEEKAASLMAMLLPFIEYWTTAKS